MPLPCSAARRDHALGDDAAHALALPVEHLDELEERDEHLGSGVGVPDDRAIVIACVAVAIACIAVGFACMAVVVDCVAFGFACVAVIVASMRDVKGVALPAGARPATHDACPACRREP